MDAKTKYKAKKIKAVFFDIDDTLRVKDTGYMPPSILKVFKALKDKGICRYCFRKGTIWRSKRSSRFKCRLLCKIKWSLC